MSILLDQGPSKRVPAFLRLVPSSSLVPTGDFTLEAFRIKFTSVADGGIYGHYNATGNQRSLLFRYTGTQLQGGMSTNGSALSQVVYTWTPTVGTLYDVCFERSGTNLRLYVDGAVVAGPTTVSSAALHNSTDSHYVGAWNNVGTILPFAGAVRALRLTLAARYSGAYTPPTLPLPVG